MKNLKSKNYQKPATQDGRLHFHAVADAEGQLQGGAHVRVRRPPPTRPPGPHLLRRRIGKRGGDRRPRGPPRRASGVQGAERNRR